MIRAVGFLVSEFLWGLVFRITGDTPTDDTPSQPQSEQARVRTEWVAKHRWPTDGGAA
jgi:hypothetical protein